MKLKITPSHINVTKKFILGSNKVTLKHVIGQSLQRSRRMQEFCETLLVEKPRVLQTKTSWLGKSDV